MLKLNIIIVFVFSFILTSCTNNNIDSSNNYSNKEFPVTINNITINELPTKIISLSPSITEIITSINKEDSIIAVSNNDSLITQNPTISTIGPYANPDINKIIELNPDIIISNNHLSPSYINLLNKNKIPLITLNMPKTLDELSQLYIQISTIMNGNVKGKEIGENLFYQLTSSIDKIKLKLNNPNQSFIYLMSLDNLMATGDTIEHYIFSSFGNNLANEGINYKFDISKVNPSFIIVPSTITKKDLESNQITKNYDAIKNNKIFSIDQTIIDKLSPNLIEQLVNDLVYEIYPDTPK